MPKKQRVPTSLSSVSAVLNQCFSGIYVLKSKFWALATISFTLMGFDERRAMIEYRYGGVVLVLVL